MSLKKSVLIITVLLLIDQVSKYYIKTHFVLGESVGVFNWFKILFIENSGAAWGAKLSDYLPVSLIFAGALGNIIDSVFYGMIFNDSYQQVATAFSAGPYGAIFHGKVVDMLYFPIIDTTWPEWVPYLAGSDFRFFEPVFNIADMAISTGVGILIVFNKRAFRKNREEMETDTWEDYVARTEKE